MTLAVRAASRGQDTHPHCRRSGGPIEGGGHTTLPFSSSMASSKRSPSMQRRASSLLLDADGA